MGKKNNEPLNHKIKKNISNIKKNITKIDKLKNVVTKNIKIIKDGSNIKELYEETKNKVMKSNTPKMRERYLGNMLSICENLIPAFNELKKQYEVQLTITESYKSEIDSIIEYTSNEHKIIAQLKNTKDRGVFIYGNTEIGEKTSSIFQTKY